MRNLFNTYCKTIDGLSYAGATLCAVPLLMLFTSYGLALGAFKLISRKLLLVARVIYFIILGFVSTCVFIFFYFEDSVRCPTWKSYRIYMTELLKYVQDTGWRDHVL